MRTIVLTLLALLMAGFVATAAFADGPYIRTRTGVASSSGGGGSTSPGSPTNSVQYNNAGSFGGSSAMTWNNASSILAVTNITNTTISSTAMAITAITGTSDRALISAQGTASTQIKILPGNGNLNINDSTGVTRLSLDMTNAITSSSNVFRQNNSLIVTSQTTLGASGSASATLHVSGTSILGVANASITCGTSQTGAVVYSPVRNTLAVCNGAQSWIPLVSTTIVSASAL